VKRQAGATDDKRVTGSASANCSGGRFIPAYKHGWPRWAVDRMIQSRTRRAFHRVRAQGMEPLRAALAAEPGGLLILANHSCWWDIFMAHVLNEAIPIDGHGMMEHFNLRRFGFFRRIGAFSVDRTDPGAVRTSIAYTAELLARPGAGVWVFPQGRMVGNDVRPLGFQDGLRAIVRRAGRVRLVTAALRYEFWQDERPEVFVRFGTPEWVERDAWKEVVPAWEKRLTDELDALAADVTAQAADRFTTVLRGPRSISDRFAAWHARLLGRTAGAPPLDLD
jgi:1-acyl-sn-glycerol-3-phosphate acyltransferase